MNCQSSSTSLPLRRYLQFKLRTLLLLVTLLAGLLGLVAAGQGERQRRAVSAIAALGGEVRYDGRSWQSSKKDLHPWVPRDWVDVVRAVRVDRRAAGLMQLERLAGPCEADLGGSQVTDAGLAQLRGLTGLETLYLDGTQVTDAGLVHLRGLTGLKRLALTGTRVTDAGMAHVRGLTGLEGLDISDTQVTDACVAELHRALPRCVIGH